MPNFEFFNEREYFIYFSNDQFFHQLCVYSFFLVWRKFNLQSCKYDKKVLARVKLSIPLEQTLENYIEIHCKVVTRAT